MSRTTRKRPYGTLYIVGAGPGDPELISVKAQKVISRADIIVYDYLAAPELLELAPAACKRIYVGKQAGDHTMKQEDICKLIVKLARTGKNVVRLKGGDPFVFGRGGEECEVAAKAGVRFEVIPGITSGIAAPAYAGIPVTHRGIACSTALITGHEDPTKTESGIAWEHLAHGVDTLVFYMGVSNLTNIVTNLTKHGRPASTPVAVIQWGSTPRQRTVTGMLSSIVDIVKAAGITAPAITVVGEVVRLRKQLSWFESRPLFGRSVIVTRSRTQASSLSSSLAEQGAAVLQLPTIDIEPSPAKGELDSAIKKLGDYSWIIFTSPNAVSIFFDRLMALRGDVRTLGSAKIASIGPGTTEAIRSYHVDVALTAEESTGEGFARALAKAGPWRGAEVLIPQAHDARDVVPDALSRLGARVRCVVAYTTVKPKNADPAIIQRIVDDHYDCIVFASSSAFTNFKALVKPAVWTRIRGRLRAVSIGPITSSTMREAGVKPVAESGSPSIPGLVKTIGEYINHDRHL